MQVLWYECSLVLFLCAGSWSCPQRLPCQCPFRKERLHLWWSGEFPQLAKHFNLHHSKQFIAKVHMLLCT